MKIKQFFNKVGLISFGGVALFMVLVLIGDFFPTDGKEAGPSKEDLERQQQAQDLYDYTTFALGLAQEAEATAKNASEIAQIAHQNAISTTDTLETMLCANTLILGQIKYKNTSDPAEQERLAVSIRNAQACLGQPVNF